MIKEIESEIDSIIVNLADKYNLSSSLKEIPEIPCDDFVELQARFRSGDAIIRIFPASISPAIFSIIAFPLEKKLKALGMFLGYLAFILSVVLSFSVSWLFISALILSWLAFSSTRQPLTLGIWIIVTTVFICLIPLNGSPSCIAFIGLVTLSSMGGLIIRKTYLSALFNRALKSEKVFAFLFTSQKITVEFNKQIIFRKGMILF